MKDTTRQYKIDGRMENSRDAQQCVQIYRTNVSLHRARALVEAASRHGHPAECTAVFEDALESLSWDV